MDTYYPPYHTNLRELFELTGSACGDSSFTCLFVLPGSFGTVHRADWLGSVRWFFLFRKVVCM